MNEIVKKLQDKFGKDKIDAMMSSYFEKNKNSTEQQAAVAVAMECSVEEKLINMHCISVAEPFTKNNKTFVSVVHNSNVKLIQIPDINIPVFSTLEMKNVTERKQILSDRIYYIATNASDISISPTPISDVREMAQSPETIQDGSTGFILTNLSSVEPIKEAPLIGKDGIEARIVFKSERSFISGFTRNNKLISNVAGSLHDVQVIQEMISNNDEEGLRSALEAYSYNPDLQLTGAEMLVVGRVKYSTWNNKEQIGFSSIIYMINTNLVEDMNEQSSPAPAPVKKEKKKDKPKKEEKVEEEERREIPIPSTQEILDFFKDNKVEISTDKVLFDVVALIPNGAALVEENNDTKLEKLMENIEKTKLFEWDDTGALTKINLPSEKPKQEKTTNKLLAKAKKKLEEEEQKEEEEAKPEVKKEAEPAPPSSDSASDAESKILAMIMEAGEKGIKSGDIIEARQKAGLSMSDISKILPKLKAEKTIRQEGSTYFIV